MMSGTGLRMEINKVCSTCSGQLLLELKYSWKNSDIVWELRVCKKCGMETYDKEA